MRQHSLLYLTPLAVEMLALKRAPELFKTALTVSG
jgi:hypothetical protein